MDTRSITHARRAAACLVMAGVGLSVAGGGTAWAAAPAHCGTPAHPALYSTTHHPAVPAVSHEVKVVDTVFVPGRAGVAEVSHPEFSYVDGAGTPEGSGWRETGQTRTIEDTPAYTDYRWMRTIIERAGVPARAAVPAVLHEETRVDEAAWVEKIVESPAVPAVKEVSHKVTVVDKPAWDERVVEDGGYAYVQKQTGKIKYKDSPSWNGEDDDHRDDDDHRGKDDDRHDDDHGKDLGWSRAPERDRTHVIHHKAVTHQEKVVTTPASPAVPEVSHLVHHPAVTHTVTIVDVPEVPAVEAVEELSHSETGWTRSADTAPEGEGWFLTGEEISHEATTHERHEWMRTVIDVPAVEAVPEVPEVSHLETVIDVPAVAARDEQLLVSEAVPAGPACATDPAVVDAAVLGGAAQVTSAAPRAAVSADPAAVPTQMLAQTGSDLAVPLGAGLTLMVVGGGLVMVGRTRSERS